MSARVSIDDLITAAAWLDVNESYEDGEAQACRRVADWLQKEAQRREDAASVARIARGAKVTPKRVREYLAGKVVMARHELKPADPPPTGPTRHGITQEHFERMKK